MYQVEALPTGQIDCDERMLFKHGDIQKYRRINCYAYLLRNARHKILIDTGIWEEEAVNRTKKGVNRWHREKSDQDVVSHLRQRSIAPEDITELILTHGHYDHAGAAMLFPNANVYLNAKEWEAIFSQENPMATELIQLREYLLEQKAKNALFLTTGEVTTAFDISLIEASGHTAGSQMIVAETQNGKALFTGDAIFLLDNVYRHLPIGFSVDEYGSAKALERCSQFKGIIYTGHDPECIKHCEEKKSV